MSRGEALCRSPGRSSSAASPAASPHPPPARKTLQECKSVFVFVIFGIFDIVVFVVVVIVFDVIAVFVFVVFFNVNIVPPVHKLLKACERT